MKSSVLFTFALMLVMPFPVLAQPAIEEQVLELKRMVEDLRQTVERQQAEIERLKGPVTVPAETPAPAAPRGPQAASGRWNPDIGVIADTLFMLDTPKDDTGGADRVSVRELELVLGSYVDPFSRMDVNIAVSDLDEVELSEAYLTRFGLPWETTARVGRFKPKFGKAAMYHRDVLDTADEPLAVRRYFGDDGLHKTGVDLTRPLDLPFESSHEITAGVLEGGVGDGGTALGTSRRRPSFYSHLKNFWDLSDVTTAELGISHLIGSRDEDASFEVNVFGLDATLIHLIGPDQRVKWQSEVFAMTRDDKTDLPDNDQLGFYSVLDHRFNKQWAAGIRFDAAELVHDSPADRGGTDYGYTGYVTFFQTDFARWRVQVNHLELAGGEQDDQVLLQGIFAIGDHKHKLT